jgi:predicted transcriptional regulator
MPSKNSSVKQGLPPPSSVAFVHNYLDEYGLDPYEFRIYAHIVRRTGGKPDGICFASLSRIAEICKMSPRRAQQSIQVLMAANMIERTKRPGRTDEYKVTPTMQWVSIQELQNLRTLKKEKDPKIQHDKEGDPKIQEDLGF